MTTLRSEYSERVDGAAPDNYLVTDDEALIRQAVELNRVVTTDEDYEAVWPLLSQMAEDVPAAIRIGTMMLSRPDPVERATGCQLLGRVVAAGSGDVKTAVIDALLAFADTEHDADVQWAMVRALDCAWDPRALPVLLQFVDHDDADLRRAAACGIFASMSDGEPDPAGLRALIGLTRDADPEVRNWAAFGLGAILDADSPEIRAALWERVGDDHAEAREEGICGLARRRDPRSIGLVAELLADAAGARIIVFEAAEMLAAPELLPFLAEYEPDDVGVAAAIEACTPKTPGS